MKNVVVAGGGASGLMAAIFAARNGASVTVLEHRDIVGKKIYATGNGKCNLTNLSDFKGKYHSSTSLSEYGVSAHDESLDRIYGTLMRFNATDTRNFFAGIGLCTREIKDRGIYPVSGQASIVVSVLVSECNRLGVKLETSCDVKDINNGEVEYIRYDKSGEQTREKIKYDKLILAMGGKACKNLGSDGSGYYFAKKLGHTVIEPLPALVQLKCEGDYWKKIEGVRAIAKIELYVEHVLMDSDGGELQITDYGISGIPVFQISSIASRMLYEGKNCTVKIDFIPFIDMYREEMGELNFVRFEQKNVVEFLSGLVHSKVASLICELNGISLEDKVSDIEPDRILKCIKMLSEFEVVLKADNGFENAQVCSGGVPLCEVDDNFKSLKDENIYIVGELLDCDGICGGYNLQWAWASGAIAGVDVCRE